MNTKNILLLTFCAIIPCITHTMEQKHKYLTQGVLVAIEGIDGSGKTTLAQSVNTLLSQRGFNTVLTKEPGDTILGKKIREIVLAEKDNLSLNICSRAEFLLFAAGRAQYFESIIIPELTHNKLIISDRFVDSSLAYQGYAHCLNFDLEKLQNINTWAMRNRLPDITIFVHTPVMIALTRCKERAELSILEHEALLKRIAYGFEEIYKNRPDVFIVDGTKSPKDLSIQVSESIVRWIEANKLLS